MLTNKNFQDLLRVAAQKKIDGLPNEDKLVVRKLNCERRELLALKDAMAEDPLFEAQVDKISSDLTLIDDALNAYSP